MWMGRKAAGVASLGRGGPEGNPSLGISGLRQHLQFLPRTVAGLNPSRARLDEPSHLLTVRFDQVEPVRA